MQQVCHACGAQRGRTAACTTVVLVDIAVVVDIVVVDIVVVVIVVDVSSTSFWSFHHIRYRHPCNLRHDHHFTNTSMCIC